MMIKAGNVKVSLTDKILRELSGGVLLHHSFFVIIKNVTKNFGSFE